MLAETYHLGKIGGFLHAESGLSYYVRGNAPFDVLLRSVHNSTGGESEVLSGAHETFEEGMDRLKSILAHLYGAPVVPGLRQDLRPSLRQELGVDNSEADAHDPGKQLEAIPSGELPACVTVSSIECLGEVLFKGHYNPTTKVFTATSWMLQNAQAHIATAIDAVNDVLVTDGEVEVYLPDIDENDFGSFRTAGQVACTTGDLSNFAHLGDL